MTVLIEDSNAGSRILYFLRSGDERIRLQFLADPPALLTGTRVRARGRLSNGTLTLTSGASIN